MYSDQMGGTERQGVYFAERKMTAIQKWLQEAENQSGLSVVDTVKVGRNIPFLC